MFASSWRSLGLVAVLTSTLACGGRVDETAGVGAGVSEGERERDPARTGVGGGAGAASDAGGPARVDAGGHAGAATDGGTAVGGAPPGPTGSPAGASGAGVPPPTETCSLPVGSPTSACPLELAPLCAQPQGWSTAPPGACELAFQAGDDPTALDHVDVAVLSSKTGAPEGRLLRVADAAACETAGNGWYFDDPAHPTKIRLCPGTCQCLGETGPSQLAVMSGCWGNAAPGVLPAEIPCPRCATARPPSCGSAQGGYGWSNVKCDFPASDVLGPLDPAHTNLKYVQHGAVAGPDEPWDGYLTYVPSLELCDTVQEGWTVDLTTSPPTFHICPTACSCLKVKEASVMVERGCPRHEAEP